MLSARVRQSQIDRLTTICAAFPDVSVVAEHHVTFLVRKRKFAYYLVDHHGNGRVELQCKADRGVNGTLVDAEPDRFFLPPYMAQHGWIGMYLDVGPVDWDEAEAFLTDAYCLMAPKALARTVAAR